MPHIKYVDYKPKGDTLRIIHRAADFLQEYAAQGYTLTLRQLYYRFIANDLFPNIEE